MRLIGRSSPIWMGGVAARRRNVFSPMDLDPLLLLDTSVADTMFQGVDGWTPANATGHPVRLMLDTSQELAQGANMFTGAWYSYGDGSYGGNTASQDALDPANRSKRITGMTIGEWYRFQSDISTTATGATIHFNSSHFFSGTSYYTRAIPSGTTSVDIYFQAQSTSMYVGAEADSDELSGWSITVANGNFTSVAGNHFTAPSDTARPSYQTGGAPHIASDGNDVLRADTALSGTITVWAAGDFSGVGSDDRIVSLGGDSGSDWNTSGHLAIAADAGGYLKIIRSGSNYQLTTGFPDYFIAEISASGHSSYGPLGVNSAVAAPAPSFARIALMASANATPTSHGAAKLTSVGVVQGALDAGTRGKLIAYLDRLTTPA